MTPEQTRQLGDLLVALVEEKLGEALAVAAADAVRVAPHEPRWLTTAQVAVRLARPKGWVLERIHDGTFVARGTGKKLISVESVEAYERAESRRPTPIGSRVG